MKHPALIISSYPGSPPMLMISDFMENPSSLAPPPLFCLLAFLSLLSSLPNLNSMIYHSNHFCKYRQIPGPFLLSYFPDKTAASALCELVAMLSIPEERNHPSRHSSITVNSWSLTSNRTFPFSLVCLVSHASHLPSPFSQPQ